jgi:hypothetical protein
MDPSSVPSYSVDLQWMIALLGQVFALQYKLFHCLLLFCCIY